MVAGKAIAALSKSKVKLRNALGMVGTAAEALILRKARSRILPLLVKTGVTVKSFAKSANKTSDKLVFTVNVGVLVTVSAPDWVISPSEVTL